MKVLLCSCDQRLWFSIEETVFSLGIPLPQHLQYMSEQKLNKTITITMISGTIIDHWFQEHCSGICVTLKRRSGSFCPTTV